MSETTNSAKRLYKILKKAKEFGDPGMSAPFVWSKVLEVEVKEDISQELSERFSNLIIIFNDVKEEITRINQKNSYKYINLISKIQSIIVSTGLIEGYSSWSDIDEIISNEALTIISICSDLIEEKGIQYNQLPSEDHDNLMHKLRELTDELTNSDLPTYIKSYLIGELRKIEQALIDVQIRGEGNLSNVTEEIIGRAILKSWKDPGKYKEYFSKIMSFAAQVNGSISLGEKISGLPNLPEAIQKILPPG